jgi:hypothetical protein
MQISDCKPASQALAESVEALAANGGAATGSNRVFRLIRGVRHSWPQDGHPRVVVEVNPIRPGNEGVGRRLARELSRELAKLTLPSQARVASIDITPVGAEESVQCGRRGFGINVEQLNQFLRDNLTTLDFSPHTIQLFEVGLGSQRWAFLSLLYSHGPRQADVVFRPLRDELKRRFGVLLRLVASPERVGVHMGHLTPPVSLRMPLDWSRNSIRV